MLKPSVSIDYQKMKDAFTQNIKVDEKLKEKMKIVQKSIDESDFKHQKTYVQEKSQNYESSPSKVKSKAFKVDLSKILEHVQSINAVKTDRTEDFFKDIQKLTDQNLLKNKFVHKKTQFRGQGKYFSFIKKLKEKLIFQNEYIQVRQLNPTL